MDKVTIKIPRKLYEKIQVIVGESGFSSPTEFIVYVLRDLVGEQMGGADVEKSGSDLTAEEIAAIRKRLRNLGYM